MQSNNRLFDIWDALSRIYLYNHEIMEYYRNKNRQKYINTIKKRLFDKIWARMQQYGEIKPPFLQNPHFIQNGCKACVEEQSGVKYGLMKASDAGFSIYINKNLEHTVKRTILAHELGHTFLYDVDQLPVKPFYSRERSFDLVAKNLYAYDEGFVYEIGRFLLIPTNVMVDYIPRKPELSSFFNSCNIFKTTRGQMVRKLFWDTYNWDTGDNYWKDAFMIFYPKPKTGTYKMPPIPEKLGLRDVYDKLYSGKTADARKKPPLAKGSDKVFRGSLLRNLRIKELWFLLALMIDLSLENPEEFITLGFTLKVFGADEDKADKITIDFKKRQLYIESKYIPSDYKVYILGSLTPEPEEGKTRREAGNAVRNYGA